MCSSSQVHALEVRDYASQGEESFSLKVRCSGGTYVRSLIEEMGRAVGSAAHMTALERTRHGPFGSREECEEAARAGDVSACPYVPPVVEAELGSPERLIAAVEEAERALDALPPREVEGPA